jgi:adenine deaminase
MFVGFVKGFKMKKGAFASSAAWVLSGIVVLGTNDEDMAGAVNRVFELQGGIVVYARGKVLAELPLPVAGLTSDLPVEVVDQKFQEVQQRATELGTWMPDVDLTLTALTSGSIPFLRICEAGLVDIRKGELVDLTV